MRRARAGNCLRYTTPARATVYPRRVCYNRPLLLPPPQLLHVLRAGSRRECLLERHHVHQGARRLQPGASHILAQLEVLLKAPRAVDKHVSAIPSSSNGSQFACLARESSSHPLESRALSLCSPQVEGVFVSGTGVGRSAGPRGTRLYGQQAESQEKTINKGASPLTPHLPARRHTNNISPHTHACGGSHAALPPQRFTSQFGRLTSSAINPQAVRRFPRSRTAWASARARTCPRPPSASTSSPSSATSPAAAAPPRCAEAPHTQPTRSLPAAPAAPVNDARARCKLFSTAAPQVAAACLYVVCRQDSRPYMLIDFSDVLQARGSGNPSDPPSIFRRRIRTDIASDPPRILLAR